MEFSQMLARAQEVRAKYAELEKKKYGKQWTAAQMAEGFVGDVGDLMKLVTAKQGVRTIEGVDAKLAHELSDCLWSILVLSQEFGVDIEKSFYSTTQELEGKITAELK